VDLERLQLALRPRSSMEAVDWGFAMARRWAWPLARSWAAAVLPAWALIAALLWRDPWWALFAIWWGKPLWERVPLFVLSRAIFGVVPTPSEVLRALPRIWTRGVAGDLLLRRFSSHRAITAPVSVLEGLSGRAAARRRSVLTRSMSGAGAALVTAGLLVEVSIAVGLAGLLLVGNTQPADVLWYELWDQLDRGALPAWIQALGLSLIAAAFTAVGPIHAAAGFGLYLSRRSEIEGWDVELIFRRLAARLKAAAVVAALAVAVAASPARADTGLSRDTGPVLAEAAAREEVAITALSGELPPEEIARVEAAVEEALADAAFGEEVTRSVWQARFELPDWGSSSSATLPWAGGLVEGLAWALFGVALVTLVASIARYWMARVAPAPGEASPPAPEVTPLGATPPPAEVAAARAMWAAGQRTEALGVLYRAAVERLVEGWSVPVDESATEGECLRAARDALPAAPGRYFTAVTRAWQAAAYAHRLPGEEGAEALFAGWSALDPVAEP